MTENESVYVQGWLGVQSLRQIERKIKACVKKSDPDPLVMFFEGSGQRTGMLGVMEQLYPYKCF